VLECVVNVSEGRDRSVLAILSRAAGRCLLDVHSDPDHHRSVFTLGGPEAQVEAGVRDLARQAVSLLDLSHHLGVHPRIGVLDVVPWVALIGPPFQDSPPPDGPVQARRARDRFAAWAGKELGLPVFLYGPDRSLPEVRKGAWRSLVPDVGPRSPHPTAGAVAVGYRPLLVAYNLWLRGANLTQAKVVAAQIRCQELRALGLQVGGNVQVSCNLLAPGLLGPAEAWKKVAALAEIERAELVGLIPETVLQATPRARWHQLDLSYERTIEARTAGRT
jgi:glutamate formiminotransferase